MRTAGSPRLPAVRLEDALGFALRVLHRLRGVFAPVSAACRPSLSAFVTRWFSCVESSATAYCSWSRATAAAGNPPTYFFITGVSHASGRTAT